MFEKLNQLEKKYEELSLLIGDPEVINDQAQWQKHVKAHAELEDVVVCYRKYKSLQEELEGALELINEEDDEEMVEMARAEAAALEKQL